MKLRLQVKRFLIATNIALVVALLLGAFAHAINPNTLLWPAFFGLGFLPLLGLNVAFIIFWLLTRPKWGFISFIAIVLSWGTVDRHLALWPGNVASEESDLTLMSFNVRLFDLYNWGGNKETRNDIFRYLEKEDPAIICFQEFFNTNTPSYFNTLDTMGGFLSAKHVHEEYTSILHRGKSKFGIATLSAYPIAHKQRIPLDTSANNVAIFSDVVIGTDTIRVFNLHLASIYISGIENDLSKHIEANDQDGQLRDLKLMTKKLSGGFKRRSHQAHVIRGYIDASPYPVIVCGDLNDTPGSYAYAHLSEGLIDAFVDHGFGFGSTYIGLFPTLRIDFILLDPRLQVHSFSTEQVTLSDHRPLLTGIGLP